MFRDSLRSGGTIRGELALTPRSVSETPLEITGYASQTADLLVVKNSAGVTLFSVQADGDVTVLGDIISIDEYAGADLVLTGDLSVGGTAAVTGATTLSSTLDVAGVVTFSSNLTVLGNLVQSGESQFGSYVSIEPNGALYLSQRGTDPPARDNEGVLYTKDTSNVAELYFKDDTGAVTQLTSAGAVGGDDVFIPDDKYLRLGNTTAVPDAILGWNTTQTVDGVYFGLATGQNTLIIAEYGDYAYDFAHGAQTNPTVFIQSANQSATEYGSLTHNQTDFLISSGAGAVRVAPATNFTATIPATGKVLIDGTTARTSTTELVDIDATINTTTATDEVGTLTVTTARESTDTGVTKCIQAHLTTGNMANGNLSYVIGGTFNSSACTTATSNAAVFYAGVSTGDAQCNDYGLYIAAGYDVGFYTLSNSRMADDISLIFGSVDSSTTCSFFQYETAQTQNALVLALDETSRCFHVCDYSDANYDFALGAQSNPTLVLHSNSQSATKYGALAHDDTDFVITSGAGNIKLAPASLVLVETAAVQMGDSDSDCSTFTMIKGAQTSDPQVQFALSGDANGNFSITADTGDITLTAADDFFVSVDGNVELALNGTELYPYTTAGLTLGTATYMWGGLYLKDTGAINWNNGNYTLTHSAGLLTANGGLTLTLPAAAKLTLDGASTPHTDLSGVLDVDMSTVTGGAFGIHSTATSTATTGNTMTGIYSLATSGAEVTADAQTIYSVYASATKSGADTNAAATNIYAVYGIAQNTGSTDAGTRNTYGSYFSATGSAAGASTAYGIYATASGADTNWAGYFNGNTFISTLASGDITISDATPALYFKDTDAAAGDVNFSITAAATDTGNGSEDIDVTFMQQIAGADVNFLVADADAYIAFNRSITPMALDGGALGVSGTGWSDVFLASGAVIDFAAGDVVLTHSANALAMTGGLFSVSYDAAGTLLTLTNTSTAYTTATANLLIARTGNLTGVAAETLSELSMAPAFAITEPGGGTFTYYGANIDLSNVTVTAGVGTSLIASLHLKACTDADAGASYSLYVEAGKSYFGGEVQTADTIGAVIGHTDRLTVAGGTSALQVLGTAGDDSTLTLGCWSETDSVHPALKFWKSGHAAISATNFTTVADDEIIGAVEFYPADGTQTSTLSGAFVAEVDDGSPAAGDVGTAFVWRLMAGGGVAIADKMRLSAAGNLTPGASDGGALGTGTLMWSDLFLASEAVINFNNGDFLMTHSANTLAFSGGVLTESYDAAGTLLTLTNTSTAYTTATADLLISRTGNLTGVAAEVLYEARIAPAFTLTEPGSGTFTYYGISVDMSGLAVTAGVGTSVVSALHLKADDDADTGTNYALYVESGRSYFAGRVLGQQGADVASANDITLGEGNYFDITGTTEVQRILGTGWTAGSVIVLQFDGAVTVKHNIAAGSGYYGFQLSGAGDFAATAGDTITLAFDGAWFREIARTAI